MFIDGFNLKRPFVKNKKRLTVWREKCSLFGALIWGNPLFSRRRVDSTMGAVGFLAMTKTISSGQSKISLASLSEL
jgi:hypothetical protein